MEFLIMRDIFKYFTSNEWEIFCQKRFQQLSLFINHLDILLIEYFCDKFLHQIKNSNSIFLNHLNLNDFRNNGKKINSRGHLEENT